MLGLQFDLRKVFGDRLGGLSWIRVYWGGRGKEKEREMINSVD